MKVTLTLDGKMRLVGADSRGHETYFDTSDAHGGEDSASTPMEIVLEAIAACSVFDILSILRKKRKHVEGLEVNVEGERAEDHPKVFTKAHIVYELTSSDAELADLERSVELSQEKYCSVSAMIRRSGCEITTECRVVGK